MICLLYLAVFVLSDKSFLCRHGSILTPFPFTGRKYFDTVSVVLDVVFFLGLLTKIVYDLTQKLYHKYQFIIMYCRHDVWWFPHYSYVYPPLDGS